jgi:hypothetical protein
MCQHDVNLQESAYLMQETANTAGKVGVAEMGSRYTRSQN